MILHEWALALLCVWHRRRYRLADWAARGALRLARAAQAWASAAMRAYEIVACRLDLLQFGRRSRRK